jgi:hypothetical protein
MPSNWWEQDDASSPQAPPGRPDEASRTHVEIPNDLPDGAARTQERRTDRMPEDMPLSVPPPPPAPTLGLGGLGKARSIPVLLLIYIVTCGIYGIFWSYTVFDEVKQYSGRGIGGGVAALIWFIFAPVNFFLLPAEVKRLYTSDGRQSPVSGLFGLLILVPLLGWAIWFVLVQGALNRFWVSKGAEPA